MTSIALNPRIILPATPQVHSSCCGHAHHHEKESPDANELVQKRVETSEPSFLTALWQKIKRWILGDSEDAQIVTESKIGIPETSIQKQLHHTISDKVAQEPRTNSPANPSRHNHSGCSHGTCSIKQSSITESRSGGGHVHSGGCCGGAHRTSNSTNSTSSGSSFSSASRGRLARSTPAESKQVPISNDEKRGHSCADHGTCSHAHDHEKPGDGLVQLEIFGGAKVVEESTSEASPAITEQAIVVEPAKSTPVEPSPALTTEPVAIATPPTESET